MFYLALKFLHIASVVIFLGNITTGAFWGGHAHKSRDFRLIASTFDGIIRSDRLFTMAHTADSGEATWQAYEKLYKSWIFWGLVALIAPVAAMLIMVFKPVLPAF